MERNVWLNNFLWPFLITIMIMCFNLSVVNFAWLFNPSWSGRHFLIGMLITTVEALYSYRLLKSFHTAEAEFVLRYRAAEWGLLLILLKVLSLTNQSSGAIWAEMESAWQDPGNLLSYEFLMMTMLAFTAWLVATGSIIDFENLAIPYENDEAQDNLADLFFKGGGILVLLSGLTQIELRSGWSSLTDFQRPQLSGVIFNVLLYFVLGIVLLGQVNLTTLLQRWRTQNIEVAPNLVKQWVKYSLIFLGGIGAVAFLLPTHYTLGFLTSVGIIITLFMTVPLFIFQLGMLLFLLFTVWLLSLLGYTASDLPMQPPSPPVLPSLAEETGSFFWSQLLQSLSFWIITLFIIGYLIKIYFTEQPKSLAWLKNLKPIAFMAGILASLWQYFNRWVQISGEVLSQLNPFKKKGTDSVTLKLRHWFGLRGQSPRDKLLYYYLDILQRVESYRFGRQNHQTPYEYEPNLSQAIPETLSEVHQLTQTFVDARYSQATFNEEQVAIAKQQWQQICEKLKNV